MRAFFSSGEYRISFPMSSFSRRESMRLLRCSILSCVDSCGFSSRNAVMDWDVSRVTQTSCSRSTFSFDLRMTSLVSMTFLSKLLQNASSSRNHVSVPRFKEAGYAVDGMASGAIFWVSLSQSSYRSLTKSSSIVIWRTPFTSKSGRTLVM